MVFDETDKGLVLRVRLTPNAATAGVKGLFKAAEGEEYLKINVRAVPEKNKATVNCSIFWPERQESLKAVGKLSAARPTDIKESCFQGKESI